MRFADILGPIIDQISQSLGADVVDGLDAHAAATARAVISDHSRYRGLPDVIRAYNNFVLPEQIGFGCPPQSRYKKLCASTVEGVAPKARADFFILQKIVEALTAEGLVKLETRSNGVVVCVRTGSPDGCSPNPARQGRTPAPVRSLAP